MEGINKWNFNLAAKVYAHLALAFEYTKRCFFLAVIVRGEAHLENTVLNTDVGCVFTDILKRHIKPRAFKEVYIVKGNFARVHKVNIKINYNKLHREKLHAFNKLSVIVDCRCFYINLLA